MITSVRATLCAVLCFVSSAVLIPPTAFSQTDPTIADSVITITPKDEIVPPGTGIGRTDWDPRDRVVGLTAPTQFKGEIKGRVSAVTGDTLVVERFLKGESNYVRVPFSEVTRCRVREGSRRNTLAGALIGALVGGGVTAAVTLSNDFSDDRAASIVMGTGGGTIVGGLIGALVKSDRWRDLPMSSLRLGVAPMSNGRLGLNLSLRF